jgi:hypothetical protein
VVLAAHLIFQTQDQMEALVVAAAVVVAQAEQELAAQATHPPQPHHKVMTVEMVLPLLETQETVAVVVVLLKMGTLQQRHLLLAMVEPD